VPRLWRSSFVRIGYPPFHGGLTSRCASGAVQPQRKIFMYPYGHEVLKGLGIKATFAVSVAASIGVKLGLSTVAIVTGVLMKNSIKKIVSVW
jgi:hypothetical protein